MPIEVDVSACEKTTDRAKSSVSNIASIFGNFGENVCAKGFGGTQAPASTLSRTVPVLTQHATKVEANNADTAKPCVIRNMTLWDELAPPSATLLYELAHPPAIDHEPISNNG